MIPIKHFFTFQIFDKEGNFKFSFGVPGKDEGQLFYPRKVAVLRNTGYYVICDRGSERSRMQIFSPMGHFIRRIPIRFIDIVAGLAISREGQLFYLQVVQKSSVLFWVFFFFDFKIEIVPQFTCVPNLTHN